MLGKLMKYEFKATARMFLPFYAALLVIALFNRLILSVESELFPVMAAKTMIIVAFVCIIIVVAVMSFIVMIMRFYKNLLGDEGYLMNTLPVKPRTHIITKLTVSLVWNISAIIVIIAALLIAFASSEFFDELSPFLSMMWEEITNEIDLSAPVLIVQSIVVMLTSLVSSVLMIYVSMAVGHMVTKHRILGSVAAYLAINTALQTVTAVVMMIAMPIFMMNEVEVDPLLMMNLVMWGSALYYVVVSVGFFFATNRILSRKLNLE